MAWRKHDRAARAAGPAWYETFDLADWDEPDEQEQAMIDGCPSMRPWPDHLHEWHARRRWGEAKYAYQQDHPALADQEFEDFLAEFPDGGW